MTRHWLAGAPATFKISEAEWRGMEQDLDTPAGRAGRLHRLQTLRGSLPGKEQERSQAQGAQHGAAGAAA